MLLTRTADEELAMTVLCEWRQLREEFARAPRRKSADQAAMSQSRVLSGSLNVSAPGCMRS